MAFLKPDRLDRLDALYHAAEDGLLQVSLVQQAMKHELNELRDDHLTEEETVALFEILP
jgi:hypothetical protein